MTTIIFYSAILCICALVVCDSESEWETVALHSAFWISTEVVTVLFGCYMAGATWNSHCLGTGSACTIQHYNHAPLYSVTLFETTYIGCMFSYNLPPALLAEWLGSFTCYCGNMRWCFTPSQPVWLYQSNMRVEKTPKYESAQDDPGEDFFPRHSCWDSNLRSFDHKYIVLDHWAIPTPQMSTT